MNRVVRIIAPIAIVLVALLAARALIASREEPPRQPPTARAPLVETVTLEPAPYQVQLHSRGVVQARTEGNIVPQVSGTVVEITPRFRAGAFFEPDDVLLRIDPRDYEIAVRIAEAEVTQARLQLAQEEARAAQARRDLERLGLDGAPSDLALRKPQLAGARATVAAAESRLDQARLQLERTVIRAPYAGRVLSQEVDIGQNVTAGTVLGRIFAVDFAEVRLPLSNRQIALLTLPPRYRDAGLEQGAMPWVTLSSVIGDAPVEWRGRIVRSEGAVDTASRQVFVIAQVDDPYGDAGSGHPPLKVGQFVEARIEGRLFPAAYRVPRKALAPDGSVFAVTEENRLQRLTPQFAWKDEHHAVALDGFEPGTRIMVSALPLATDGMPVQVQNGPHRSTHGANAP